MLVRATLVILIVLIATSGSALNGRIEASQPRLPDANLCQVNPRELAEVESLVPTMPPVRELADELQWEGSREATADEMSAIEALFLEFFACYNNGDFLRQTALVTDEALARGIVSIAGFVPPEELQVWFEGVYAGYSFADGRIGAVVVASTAAEYAPLQAAFFLVKYVDGRWLVENRCRQYVVQI